VRASCAAINAVPNPNSMLTPLAFSFPSQSSGIRDTSVGSEHQTADIFNFYRSMMRLSDHGRGGGGLVLPGGGKDADGLVVAGKTVDTGLDENEAELGVLVLAVALEVLADGDSLG
jgi:hypothetical protein